MYNYVPSILSCALITDSEAKELVKQWLAKRKKTLTVVTSGRVGAGKSALVNGLVGAMVCDEADTPYSVTQAVGDIVREIHGITVKLFDTPGLDDPAKNDADTLQEIKQKTNGKGDIDLLLFCIRMTERIDMTHCEMIGKLAKVFGESIWKKKALFVLTFANEVKAPREARGRPDEKDSLRQHFIDKHEKFKTALVRSVSEYAKRDGIDPSLIVSPDTIEQVPIVPAGYDEPGLPNCSDWLSHFWTEAFNRLQSTAQPALAIIAQSRFEENQRAENMQPYERPIAGSEVDEAISKSIGLGEILSTYIKSAFGSISNFFAKVFGK